MAACSGSDRPHIREAGQVGGGVADEADGPHPCASPGEIG
jgi:hypothetical protein